MASGQWPVLSISWRVFAASALPSAERAIGRRAKEAEAVERFGNELWDDTPAEVFSLESLRTVERVN